MPITALPNPPSRSDPANFPERADAFMAALPGFAQEANMLQAQVNEAAEAADENATAAMGSAQDAANSRAQAGLSAGGAASAADAAAQNATEAASSAALAADWANKTGAPVGGGEFSAKHYAQLAAQGMGLPVFAASSIPSIDKGPIYVSGIGSMNWNGAAYSADTASGLIPTGGFKNLLMNGKFNINQRAVSGTVVLPAGAYGHDRWKAGSAGCTYTFFASAGVTSITILAGTLMQVIEGNNLSSGDHVLSWTGTARGRIGGGSYGVSPVSGAVTGGTNTSIEFGTGTLALTQFEAGLNPTMFENRAEGAEMDLCLRYAEIRRSQTNFTQFAIAQAISPSQAQTAFTFRRKRAAPTIVYSANADFAITTSAGASSGNIGMAFSQVGVDSASMSITASSAALVAGNATIVQGNNTAAAAISIVSEL